MQGMGLRVRQRFNLQGRIVADIRQTSVEVGKELSHLAVNMLVFRWVVVTHPDRHPAPFSRYVGHYSDHDSLVKHPQKVHIERMRVVYA